MILPVANNYEISCPFNKKGNKWKAGFHTGIDLITKDKNIFSSCNGILYKMGFDIKYGNYIVIKDLNFNFHWYCHLSKNILKENQKSIGYKVKENEFIGIMGKTGNATGVHLHYEIRKKCNCYGKVYNPLEYIKNNIKAYQYLKIAFTGAMQSDYVLISYKDNSGEKLFWVNIENVNASKDKLIIKDTGSRQDNKVLIEVETIDNPIQFWVLEKDLI